VSLLAYFPAKGQWQTTLTSYHSITNERKPMSNASINKIPPKGSELPTFGRPTETTTQANQKPAPWSDLETAIVT
jgi:hypothetical protein